MKNISLKEITTARLLLKKPTMFEQPILWNILRDEQVNKYYFPTPDRIFKSYNLKKDNLADLQKARKIFMEQLNDWNRQKPFYENKINDINNEKDSQKFTWSIFLKNGEAIGQMTVQPCALYSENPAIRDVGWFINPQYQGQGLATEAATAILDFMFNEVAIDSIFTSAAIINPSSWKVMEKLGFERTGEKQSSYFDENGNILMSYCYHCTKELFNNREKIRIIKKI